MKEVLSVSRVVNVSPYVTGVENVSRVFQVCARSVTRASWGTPRGVQPWTRSITLSVSLVSSVVSTSHDSQ